MGVMCIISILCSIQQLWALWRQAAVKWCTRPGALARGGGTSGWPTCDQLEQATSFASAVIQVALGAVRLVLSVGWDTLTLWRDAPIPALDKGIITGCTVVGVACGGLFVLLFSRRLKAQCCTDSKLSVLDRVALAHWLDSNLKPLRLLKFAAMVQPGLLTLLYSNLFKLPVLSMPVVKRSFSGWRLVWLGDLLTSVLIGGGQVGSRLLLD